MFGLRKLFRKILGNPEVQKLETEVKDFFVGAADYLLHKHGAKLVHTATTAAVKGAQIALDLSLSGEEKHAQVSSIVKEAVKDAETEFSTSDINSVIEAALKNVQAHELASSQPETTPPGAAPEATKPSQ